MALLNYTTQVSAEKSIAEIQGMLARAKAESILMDFDNAGNIVALTFRITTDFGQMGFKLPADPGPIQLALKRQVEQRLIPRRFAHDVPQARRVAWRIVKDWVEAQLALVETRMTTIDQVFLPYAQTLSGQTFYARLKERKFEGLALPPPSDNCNGDG